MRLSFSLLLCALALVGRPCDWVWTGRYVITMDPQRRVIEDGAVAVQGGRVIAVGSRSEIAGRFEPKQRLDRPEAVLAPGLINAHTHAAMSLFRGLADDLRLQDWLEKFIFPAERKNVTAEFVRWGTRLACLEMLLSGTTTYADMYYFEDVVAEVTREAGMRGVLGETIIGYPAPDARIPADSLKLAEVLLARYRNDALVVPAVAPHALYSNADADLRFARVLANRYSAPLLIHVAETKREQEESVAKRGRSPVGALDSLGIFNGRTVAAHSVWVDDSDLAILKARGVGVVHCPSSNMKLASGVAPITKMLAANIAVGLGADGPAGSNNDLNLFEEMDLAAKLQKVITGDPQALPARTALEMATIRGAAVLGLEKDIGSIEPGKRADLISVRLDRPHAVPMYDVYSQFVYALKGSDVRDVMVDGKIVVRDRQVLTLDSRQILAGAREFGVKVRVSVPAH